MNAKLAAYAGLLSVNLIILAQADENDLRRQFNTEFGLQLFESSSIWEEQVKTVAGRLSWPIESQTSSDSSYRKYPNADEKILGCRPFSLALHGEDGKPSSLSLVFANKGDSVMYQGDTADSRSKYERKKQLRNYKRDIQQDKENITNLLTKLFGDPKMDRFGAGGKTTENVKRWDFSETTFLLAAPRDEYVNLRILPTTSADAGGKSRISDADIRLRVAARVETRENGDILLKDIPMINQGPKGYCVPATWARAMRYMGVPADMYVLAMAGQTEAGGGTSMNAIQSGAKQAVIRFGRRVESRQSKLDLILVARYIDKGLPMIWAMYSTKEFNALLNKRQGLRTKMTDADEWVKTLNEDRRERKKIRPASDASHVCMIIGYNKKTKEVCISDSWGPEFMERWATIDEAQSVSQGYFQIINF